jgi:hypothetical protein
MGIDPSQKGPDFATVDPSAAVDPTNQTATASPQMMKTVTPQPTAPTAPTQPAPAAPSVTTPPVAPSPNARLHSFVSSTLSAIVSSMAGKGPTSYAADPTTGKIVGTPVQESQLDKLRRVGANALSGLGAGAQAGGQKSGLANALAGLGAGAQAQSSSAQAADKQAKQQANEDFDRQQQKILRMHDIARGNMLMVSTMQHIYQEELDHDPVRKLNAEWASAAEDEDIPVQYMTESEAAALYKKTPQQLLAEHIVMPLGKKAVMDQNGEPVIDAATGQPKFEGQLVAINGLHDGQFDKVPQSFVDAAKKYAPYSGQGITGLDALTAEHPMSVQDFTKLHTAIQEGRKAELAGWAEKTPGANAVQDPNDPKGVLQYNPLTQETRPYKGGKPLGAAKEQADITEKEANANKKDNSGQVTPLEKFRQDREDARARMRKAADDKAGQNTDVFGNVSALSEKEFNKRYDSFNKSKQYQTLGVLQGSYDQFQQAVKDIDSGKPLSGAQSVVQLFNAIGISATPLAGKGFRINENTVKEHVEARGLDQSALQKLEKLETGAVITEKQLKDYAGIATQVYKNSFINAAKEQKRQLGYIDVLPLGNNEPVDAMTASLYLQTAGGDRAKAESALKKSGWLIPQR